MGMSDDIVGPLNPCRITGSPAVFQTRRQFHDEDTLEKHFARYGLTPEALNYVGEVVKEIAKGFHKEEPEPSSKAEHDFRIVATKGMNTTGWKHATHPDEEAPGGKKWRDLGMLPEVCAIQRQKLIDACIKEWNDANPVKNGDAA